MVGGTDQDNIDWPTRRLLRRRRQPIRMAAAVSGVSMQRAGREMRRVSTAVGALDLFLSQTVPTAGGPDLKDITAVHDNAVLGLCPISYNLGRKAAGQSVALRQPRRRHGTVRGADS